MAVAPLFVVDMDDLKSRLRLSDTYGADVLSIIDDQTTLARLRFLDHLGLTRVQELQAIVSNENPLTDDERLRAKAEICEVLLVKKGALETLPTIFANSSAEAVQDWNDAEFTRDFGVERFKSEKSRAQKLATGVEQQIIEMLDELKGEEMDDSKVDIEVIETETSGRRLNSFYAHGRL